MDLTLLIITHCSRPFKYDSNQENDLLDKCSLILVAAKMDEVAKQNLLTTWKDFDVLGVWDLDYFFSMLPKPIVKTKHDLLVVERAIEQQRLADILHFTISLSGKYRCGKTTLFNQCYGEDHDCIFVELPSYMIEPLSLC